MSEQNMSSNILTVENNSSMFENAQPDSSVKSNKRKNSSKTTSQKKIKHQKSDEPVKEVNRTHKCLEGSSNAETVENVLEDMEEEIDNALESSNNKSKLTSANVKNILRHIIANEYVLAMVRNTMKMDNEELDEATYEPKLTRSKAKEMRQKQCTLPWPVSSPVKKVEKASKKLLEEEYPDECSSDEDYKPNEEECPSDDDDVITSPHVEDATSPHSVKPSSSSPVSSIPELLSEDENALMIELPELEVSPDTTEADKIALRTRSKLPLNDTLLEDIEASFIAPDITIDMYDTKCDDEEWQEFLFQLYKPTKSVVVAERPEETDDAEDDPEYKVVEDDIPDYNDLRYDSSVKITRDEMNGLMAEILEFTQQDLNFICEEEDEENRLDFEHQSSIVSVGPVSVENVKSQWMSSDERLQLDEQMRMYVQILSQSYLLSHANPRLNFINVSSKLFLDEMKMFASREMASNEKSAFYAQNLDGALDIINEFESRRPTLRPRSLPKMRKVPILPGVPQHVKKTLASNKVFIYPELLPICGFQEIFEKQKTQFSLPEDNLIALGLEQFTGVKNPVEYIQSLLVPTKTVEQIKFRIKNSKVKKDPLTSPIKFYHVYKQAPQFQRVIRIFDPDNIKPPSAYPPDVLPKWMVQYSKFSSQPAINPLLAPSQVVKSSPQVGVVRPMFRKQMEPKKLSPILPRGLHFSPLKHISPILKKYSQQRRVVPIAPFSVCSPSKRKPAVHPQRQLNKPLKPKPIPMDTNHPTGPELTVHKTEDLKPIAIKDGSISVLTGDSSASRELRMDIKKGAMSSVPKVESAVEVEISDDVDDEVIEDEQDPVAATVVNNTTGKKHSVSKKRNRLQRDLEASLALLQPTLMRNDPMKEEREVLFANSYLLRATEILKGNLEVYEKFLAALCKYHQSTRSPVELYAELKEILKDYPALVRDFIVFLQPDQAKECGRYKEHIALNKIREFFRKIEVHFKNQPQHISRILRTFAQLQQQVDITSSEVIVALQPLLRNQTHLLEELNHLLPDVKPPEYLMTDFESVTIPNSDDDNSSIDSCEEIVIPDTPDPYGGKDCPCDCHNSSTDNRMLNRSRHCVKCGVKFIDGRIYIQTGKVLKPAQVTYHDPPPPPPNPGLTEKRKNSGPQLMPKTQPSSEANSSKNSHGSEINSKSDTASSKKDGARSSATLQKSLLSCNEEILMKSSKLPCDVIEDTVFPAVTQAINRSAPSDFSHLKHMIGPSKKNEDSEGSDMKTGYTIQNMKWTGDEDKLILYNCQRYGVSKKAFSTTAIAIKTTAEEVEERLLNLMKILSEEIKKQ